MPEHYLASFEMKIDTTKSLATNVIQTHLNNNNSQLRDKSKGSSMKMTMKSNNRRKSEKAGESPHKKSPEPLYKLDVKLKLKAKVS